MAPAPEGPEVAFNVQQRQSNDRKPINNFPNREGLHTKMDKNDQKLKINFLCKGKCIPPSRGSCTNNSTLNGINRFETEDAYHTKGLLTGALLV